MATQSHYRQSEKSLPRFAETTTAVVTITCRFVSDEHTPSLVEHHSAAHRAGGTAAATQADRVGEWVDV
jgi:hypothetical protein